MGETKPTRLRKKSIVVAASCVLLLAGGGSLAWRLGAFGRLGGHAAQSASADDKPVLIDLPDMVSNLDTGGHRASFVKVHVKLQVAHARDVVIVQAAEPELMDIVQTYLRAMRPDDIRGGEGTYRLRESLMNRIDARLAPVEVTDLLFTQLLVQ